MIQSISNWEGNIQSPITDNRFIGVLKIAGTDIASGVVPTGADIECERNVRFRNHHFEASIPCIGALSAITISIQDRKAA